MGADEEHMKLATRTSQTQRLRKVVPIAMVDSRVADQDKVDEGECDLKTSGIEEVGWRNRSA